MPSLHRINRTRKSNKFWVHSSKTIGTSDTFPEVKTQIKLPSLTYRELAKATNNFHPFKHLGRGQFAMVYHGVLQDGREIAVQRFYDDEFKRFQQHVNHTVILSLLPHKNLVSVYGCAFNRKEYLLVHEYVPNGTLAHHLLGEGTECIMLPWHTRLDIAIDTANALAYLHSNGIIHGNITPHNILLDENFCAKVKGILLSWKLPTGVSGCVTHVTTHKIRGKYSYMDPDYLEIGRLSVKSDVYSFGVVLCQLLSSQPAMDWEIDKPITHVTSVIRKYRNHALDKPLDPNLGFESDSGIMQMINKVAELATQCLNNDEELRPSMKQVFEGLKGIREGRRLSDLISGEDLEQQNPGLEHNLEDEKHVKHPFQIFSNNTLAEASNHFDTNNYLGKGGFGSVYFGNLPDGRQVAIKRFHEKKDKTIEQFMKEIKVLSRLRHQNLVSLYGCSSENSDALLLVYEYVSNGSLANNINLHSGSQLPWLTRLNIATETACALAYLHDSGIIHRDVKSSNILLDENFGVKVGDFGLARFLPLDLDASQGDPGFVTHVSTIPVGTPAFMDPEYYESNRVSDKSDVYSFGVVLFQLISSKPSSFTQGPQYFTLAIFAMGKILSNALEEIVDPSLGFDSDNRVMETITAVAELAFQCVQCPKELRPSMRQVLETLSGIQQGSWGFNQIT